MNQRMYVLVLQSEKDAIRQGPLAIWPRTYQTRQACGVLIQRTLGMALGGARDAHVGSLVGITSQSRGNQDVAHSMSTLLSSFVVAVPFPSCLTRIVASSSQHIVFWAP